MCCKCQLAALNARRVAADDIHWALVNKGSRLLTVIVFGIAFGVLWLCCSAGVRRRDHEWNSGFSGDKGAFSFVHKSKKEKIDQSGLH